MDADGRHQKHGGGGMAKIDFTLDESVAVVALKDGENRFNPDFLNTFSMYLWKSPLFFDSTSLKNKG